MRTEGEGRQLGLSMFTCSRGGVVVGGRERGCVVSRTPVGEWEGGGSHRVQLPHLVNVARDAVVEDE